jgi:glutathione-independent formaldehyde dehydrogenase
MVKDTMASNRAVVYLGPGRVEVQSIDFPKLELEYKGKKRKCEHGVILKVVATNICGSDLHMVRGRMGATAGLVLGHEITGEVIEVGRDVELFEKGDLASVPFNIACGRCRNCAEGKTELCLHANPDWPGAAFGIADMGGWIGGQAEYVMAPYADFNLLKFRDKDRAMSKITDLAMLSDIFPTGFHSALTAGVGPGSTVYVAGAGPVGLACAHSAQLLGAAVVIVGDRIEERLEQARSFGCETVDIKKDATVAEQIDQILGEPEVDCAVDCVGFEARGHGSSSGKEVPAQVLNTMMTVVRAGGDISVPGIYVTEDPGGVDAAAKAGNLSIRIGLGWAKSCHITAGVCPVKRYNRQLMQAILYGKANPAKATNATLISLDDAPRGYKDFDKGAAKKFVIDPHQSVA